MQIEPMELLNIQVSALFTDDGNERLKYIREPGFDESELDAAPRFFMGRTLQGNIWRFRYDLPGDVVQTVEQICHNEPVALNLFDPPHYIAAIRSALAEHKPIDEEERGPAYWIPNSIGSSANSVLISETNKSLLETHFPWKITSQSNFQTAPLVATVHEGKAVSICYCARITSVAAEAGVETVESYRGHGYAGAAVAKWADIIRLQGVIPLYSTSWKNRSSQSVAGKLQMIRYAEDWSIA